MFNLLENFQRRINKVWKRWQLCHATDFQSLMYPCFTFSHILGAFPYKINASVFEASRWRYILLTIITCIVCVNIINIYLINTVNRRSQTFEKIQDNFYNVLESFIIIVSFILSGPRMRLLQNILEVSSKLPPKSFEKLSKMIHIKDIFGFFFLIVLQSVAISLGFSQNENIIIYLCKNIMESYINFQILQLNMLYINCVYILKTCFERINDNLRNLRELMINNEPHLLRLIYYQQRNLLVLKELKILEKQYLMVSDTVQKLNIIFSPQLLATFGLSFIEITFELYYQWQNGLSIKFQSIFLKFYILYYVVKMILIIWVCETGKNQATELNTTVYDVLNNTSDEQIKNEVSIKLN